MTEEAVLLVLDYDRVCRICLKTQGVLSPLFDNENTYSTTDVNNEDLPPLHIQLEVITGVWVRISINIKLCVKNSLLLFPDSEFEQFAPKNMSQMSIFGRNVLQFKKVGPQSQRITHGIPRCRYQHSG